MIARNKREEAQELWETLRVKAVSHDHDRNDWHYCFGYHCYLTGDNPGFNTMSSQADVIAAKMGWDDAKGDYPP